MDIQCRYLDLADGEVLSHESGSGEVVDGKNSHYEKGNLFLLYSSNWSSPISRFAKLKSACKPLDMTSPFLLSEHWTQPSSHLSPTLLNTTIAPQLI